MFTCSVFKFRGLDLPLCMMHHTPFLLTFKVKYRSNIAPALKYAPCDVKRGSLPIEHLVWVGLNTDLGFYPTEWVSSKSHQLHQTHLCFLRHRYSSSAIRGGVARLSSVPGGSCSILKILTHARIRSRVNDRKMTKNTLRGRALSKACDHTSKVLFKCHFALRSVKMRFTVAILSPSV